MVMNPSKKIVRYYVINTYSKAYQIKLFSRKLIYKKYIQKKNIKNTISD